MVADLQVFKVAPRSYSEDNLEQAFEALKLLFKESETTVSDEQALKPLYEARMWVAALSLIVEKDIERKIAKDN
jgi:hypothetical protein